MLSYLGTPPGGYPVRYPPGGSGYPPGGGSQIPPGGVPGQVPPWGGPGTPPRGVQVPLGGVPDRVPPQGGTWLGTPPGGTRPSPQGGYPDPRGGYLTGYPPWGGTQVGQHKEYSLHSGRYASCVHAGGLSCFVWMHMTLMHNKILIPWLSWWAPCRSTSVSPGQTHLLRQWVRGIWTHLSGSDNGLTSWPWDK